MEDEDLYGDWYDFFGTEEETTDETFTDEYTPTDTPMYEDYYGGE